MSQSSEATASPRGNGSKPKNFHVIELDWAHQFVEYVINLFVHLSILLVLCKNLSVSVCVYMCANNTFIE